MIYFALMTHHGGTTFMEKAASVELELMKALLRKIFLLTWIVTGDMFAQCNHFICNFRAGDVRDIEVDNNLV